jgi:hypothetical protein
MFQTVKHFIFPLILASVPAAAQSSSAATPQPYIEVQTTTEAQPQLSPGAAYREALRPVVVTHAAIANWSDIETASLAIAIKQASAACSARKAEDFHGASLVDLSRLCALGLQWPNAASAANSYIHEEASSKPRLAEAYSALVYAELQLKDEVSALRDAQTMLAALPYSSLVAESTSQAISYMHLLYTPDAELLAMKRQPMLLAALRSTTATTDQSVDAVPTTSELYKQALTLAELQQLQGESSAAAKTILELESSLPSALSADDKIAVDGARRRYALIGKPLPPIAPLSSLRALSKMPALPARQAITVLMLYPDWCAQCVRLARQIPTDVFAVEEHNAYMYGLLAQTVPPEKLPKPHGRDQPAPNQSANPAYAADSLRGTSTLTVAPTLLDTFNATELPLLIVTDSDGIVRLLDVANESALQPGDMVDAAVALIGRRPTVASK